MANKLTADEIETLSTAIAKALQQARSVSDSEHYDHHIWVKAQIAKEQKAAEFWGKMTEHVAKWGAVSVLSALFYALWLGIKSELHLAALAALWRRDGE